MPFSKQASVPDAGTAAGMKLAWPRVPGTPSSNGGEEPIWLLQPYAQGWAWDMEGGELEPHVLCGAELCSVSHDILGLLSIVKYPITVRCNLRVVIARRGGPRGLAVKGRRHSTSLLQSLNHQCGSDSRPGSVKASRSRALRKERPPLQTINTTLIGPFTGLGVLCSTKSCGCHCISAE
ncbi:hypothetical protein EJ03DRAFT_112944 [Teratosphaeria nubilosa]|uniref:Uncharacterized protein n=1 Tax=Teratosphaeria nubilosa TaxID=161662 RepID=A0A6G1L899_9PEZI|nr:hypothetical protein EJ03DRAFT_112944 [Teratosphaeria nubilosa]